MEKIYTIGYSNHSIEEFVERLQKHDINAVADVRSVPYSKWQPRFNRDNLIRELKKQGIKYVFLGRELGARSEDPKCYDNEGRVRYSKLAETEEFRSGIKRVMEGRQRMRIALMCAEKDPLDCHRTILVARELVNRSSVVEHILDTGKIETHERVVERMKQKHGSQLSLLPEDEAYDEAYSEQEKQIAYMDEEYKARV